MEQALIDHAFDVIGAEFASSERLQFLEVSDVIPRQTTIGINNIIVINNKNNKLIENHAIVLWLLIPF